MQKRRMLRTQLSGHVLSTFKRFKLQLLQLPLTAEAAGLYVAVKAASLWW
jgi:hypothetical protein